MTTDTLNPEAQPFTAPQAEALPVAPMEAFVAKAEQVAVLKDPTAYTEDYLKTAQLQRRKDVTEETIEAALANADIMKETARVSIRMPEQAFVAMFNGDGVYKTVRESGTSRGVSMGQEAMVPQYLSARDQAEKRIGIQAGDGEPSVVYGFLDNLVTASEVTPALDYGLIAITLKPEVMQRSTFTKGDSLKPDADNKMMDASTAIVAKELNDIEEYSGGNNERYIEAQIFGGVTVDDVEGVSLTLESGNLYKEDAFTEVATFIAGVKEKRPDLPLTVRIPMESGISPTVADLIAKYPDVSFVGFVDVGGDSTPYKTMLQLENNGFDGDFKKSEQEKSQKNYDKAKNRVSEVEAGLQKYFEQATGQPKLPDNLKVVLTDSNFGNVPEKVINRK